MNATCSIIIVPLFLGLMTHTFCSRRLFFYSQNICIRVAPACQVIFKLRFIFLIWLPACRLHCPWLRSNTNQFSSNFQLRTGSIARSRPDRKFLKNSNEIFCLLKCFSWSFASRSPSWPIFLWLSWLANLIGHRSQCRSSVARAGGATEPREYLIDF